jgi:CRISPR/Cas system-associated protein Cas7 (RAMP superfamily)
MYEKETLEDVVIYLLQKGQTDPEKIARLIFIADMHLLIKYGKPILKDSITVEDSEDHSGYYSKYWIIEKEDVEKIIKSVSGKTSEFLYLSEYDKKYLDDAINREELDGFWAVPTVFGRRVERK